MVRDEVEKESRSQTNPIVWTVRIILHFLPRTLVQTIEGFVCTAKRTQYRKTAWALIVVILCLGDLK